MSQRSLVHSSQEQHCTTLQRPSVWQPCWRVDVSSWIRHANTVKDASVQILLTRRAWYHEYYRLYISLRDNVICVWGRRLKAPVAERQTDSSGQQGGGWIFGLFHSHLGRGFSLKGKNEEPNDMALPSIAFSAICSPVSVQKFCKCCAEKTYGWAPDDKRSFQSISRHSMHKESQRVRMLHSQGRGRGRHRCNSKSYGTVLLSGCTGQARKDTSSPGLHE